MRTIIEQLLLDGVLQAPNEHEGNVSHGGWTMPLEGLRKQNPKHPKHPKHKEKIND